MKKIILMTVFAAVISSASFAQASFGVQIGGTLASAQREHEGGSNTTKTNTRWGLIAGGVAEIPLGPVSFRPEVNFIQKGFKSSDTNVETLTPGGGITSTSTYFSDDKVRLNYIEVPLNFIYNINAGGGKFFVGLGPDFGFGLSGKDNSKFTNTVTTTLSGTSTSDVTRGDVEYDVRFDGKKNATDDKLHLKRLDFGASALVGYKFSMGLFIDAGYTIGLTDITANDDGSNESLKNNGLTFKIGYLFGCNKTKTSKSSSTSTGSGTF